MYTFRCGKLEDKMQANSLTIAVRTNFILERLVQCCFHLKMVLGNHDKYAALMKRRE